MQDMITCPSLEVVIRLVIGLSCAHTRIQYEYPSLILLESRMQSIEIVLTLGYLFLL